MARARSSALNVDPNGLCDTHCNNSWINTDAELVRVKASEPSNNSLITKRYGTDNLANGMDFNLDVAGEGTTKVIKVMKYTNPITGTVTTTLVPGAISDITENSVIIVKYDGTKTTLNRYDAELIYVVVDAGKDTNPDVNTKDASITGTYDAPSGVVTATMKDSNPAGTVTDNTVVTAYVLVDGNYVYLTTLTGTGLTRSGSLGVTSTGLHYIKLVATNGTTTVAECEFPIFK